MSRTKELVATTELLFAWWEFKTTPHWKMFSSSCSNRPNMQPAVRQNAKYKTYTLLQNSYLTSAMRRNKFLRFGSIPLFKHITEAKQGGITTLISIERCSAWSSRFEWAILKVRLVSNIFEWVGRVERFYFFLWMGGQFTDRAGMEAQPRMILTLCRDSSSHRFESWVPGGMWSTRISMSNLQVSMTVIAEGRKL